MKLNGLQFAVVAEIQRAVTDELKKVQKEEFSAASQKMNDCANAYTGCNRRNGPDFGRVFLGSNYTDITQNTCIQSSMVTEILAREV